jgi:hypothetical protein
MTDQLAQQRSTNTRNVSVPTRNLLWAKSAGLCAFPNCRAELIHPANELDDAATLGDIAHIHSHSTNGPRANPDGFNESTNLYDNLILLCATHHRLVDRQHNTYTVTNLRTWKQSHEAWIEERLKEAEFDNTDLETIINWLTDEKMEVSNDFVIRPIEDKMQHNSLSISTQNLIKNALFRVNEVAEYVSNRSKLETSFAERLLSPLSSRYEKLRNEGVDNNSIFEDLRQFSSGYSKEFKIQLAGLTVVVYFFERCELFEK